MPLHRPRARTLIACSVLALLVAIGGGAWALLAGWFDAGSLQGTPQGYIATKAPPNDAVASSWPSFGYSTANARSNTALTVNGPLRPRWSVDAGSLIELPPVIGAGRVVVGTNHARAIAIDLENGHIDWSYHLPGAVAASPALSGLTHDTSGDQTPQLDLFVTMAGAVVALDPATGRLRWHLRLDSAIETSPLVIGDAMYAGTRKGSVVRISLHNHSIDWKVRVDGAVKGAIARSDANIVVGDYSGHVQALRQDTGERVWRVTSPGGAFRGPGRFYAGASVAYGRVFIGNVNGRVLGINATTGTISWVRVLSDYVYSSAAVADNLVFVGCYDHNLYALNAITGAQVWHRDLGAPISGAISVLGDRVWASTLGSPVSAGRNYGLDLHTGAIVQRFPTGRYVAAIGIRGTLLDTGIRTVSALTIGPAS